MGIPSLSVKTGPDKRYRMNGDRSPIIQNDGTALVKLTRGLFSVIDAEDVDLIAGYTWYAIPTHDKMGKFYAVTSWKIGPKEIKRAWMHRLIMKPSDDEVVDHFDRDSLNNRRGNLRLVTAQENAINVTARMSEFSTGYLGVYSKWGKFQAVVRPANGFPFSSKTFSTLKEAVAWRRSKMSERYGDKYKVYENVS